MKQYLGLGRHKDDFFRSTAVGSSSELSTEDRAALESERQKELEKEKEKSGGSRFSFMPSLPSKVSAKTKAKAVKEEDLAATGSWAWAWALDEDEHPPPSSIVSRRDTEEARRLAKIADQAVFMDENALSGNNLWSLIVDFLTITPDRDASKHKHKHKQEHSHGHDDDEGAEPDGHPKDTDGEVVVVEGKGEKDHHPGKPEGASRGEKIMSRFSRLMAEKKKLQGGGGAAEASEWQRAECGWAAWAAAAEWGKPQRAVPTTGRSCEG